MLCDVLWGVAVLLQPVTNSPVIFLKRANQPIDYTHHQPMELTMTITYYVHIDDNGQPTGPRAKLLGTPAYGYKTQYQAILNCPDEASVEERHCTESDDWAGRIIGFRTSEGHWVTIA
jgi:hypothetical protein